METKLNVIVLGGCFMQAATEIIEETGFEYGLRVRVATGWPEDLHAIEEHDARVVVFQSSTMWLLGPLWDGSAFIDDEERLRRLALVKNYLSIAVKKLLDYAPGRLLLVQGVAPPTASPHGRMDFRLGVSFARVVFEINEHIRALIREHPNAMFVDEGRVFANHGAASLMDDVINVYSHHAPLDFSTAPAPESESRRKSFGLQTPLAAVRLLAREYFECYRLWAGWRQVKCVVVDLDNTLWPGEVEDSEFSLEGYLPFEFLRYGRFGGLHQALKILKQRGVLLATCSRNDFDDVMRHWRSLGDAEQRGGEERLRTSPPPQGETLAGVPYMLHPEDFVLHKINWRRKSENIAEIARELGIGLDSILFIDDNPVNREEVQAAFPEVRTLGEDMNRVRVQLLNDPSLEFNVRSGEAGRRTEMMKAQLRRQEEARKIPDEATFLRGLRIGLAVSRVCEERQLGRVAELLQRTNQFNTTGARPDAAALRQLMADPEARIYVAEVTDRFSHYGVVGVCAIVGSRVEHFALSCRVIELQVAVPFLVTALRAASPALPVTARIAKTPRNLPCHDLYANAGFAEAGGGGDYLLEDEAALRRVDESIYHITTQDSEQTESVPA